MNEWIRESNLIEGVDELEEDRRSLRAWRWFVKQPLTVDSVFKLHRKIMLKKLGKEAGRLRTCNVMVGSRLCPRPEYVPNLLLIWFGLWETAQTSTSIKEAHVHFECIHPFVDGNGRTGRMVMNWQFVHSSMNPLCIKASERWAYYNWFKETI